MSFGFQVNEKNNQTIYFSILNQTYGLSVQNSPEYRALYDCVSGKSSSLLSSASEVVTATLSVLKKSAMNCLVSMGDAFSFDNVKDSLTPPKCIAPWRWAKCAKGVVNTFRGFDQMISKAFNFMKNFDLSMLPPDAIIQLICSSLAEVALRSVASFGAGIAAIIDTAVKKFQDVIVLFNKYAKEGMALSANLLSSLLTAVSPEAKMALQKLASEDPEKLAGVMQKCTSAK